MGNASPWCKSFCAKNPMKSGLKKYGALENNGEVEYDEKTGYPINTVKPKPSIMLDEIEIVSGENYSGVKKPIPSKSAVPKKGCKKKY